MKYIEFGIGNKWMLRTEVELSNDYEFEVKGVLGGIIYKSIYCRLWIGKRVYIIDSEEGFKIKNKNKNMFKLIFGIKSEI
jgi:hypothetical protein